jgi:hypothetical protein
MNNREHFEFLENALEGKFTQTKEGRVELLVNMLIDALYIPTIGEHTRIPDKQRIKFFDIDFSEPVNWGGGLHCCEVKEFADGSFLVTLEEASPNDCQTLCEYIEKYMNSYGWTVRVETEW